MSGPFENRHSSFDISQRLSRLNLAVHGLEGEIKHGGNINSYYDDPHEAPDGRLGIDDFPAKPQNVLGRRRSACEKTSAGKRMRCLEADHESEFLRRPETVA